MSDEQQQPTVTVGPFPGRLGPHTAAARNRMKDGKPGDFIGVDEMTRVVGRDCSTRGEGRGNVDTAIRGLEPDVVWRWNVGRQGWICLGPEGRAGVVDQTRKTARKAVNRGLKIAVTTDTAGLDQDQRRDLDINRAMLGMMAMSGSGEFRKKLRAIENGSFVEPDKGKLVELMKGK